MSTAWTRARTAAIRGERPARPNPPAGRSLARASTYKRAASSGHVGDEAVVRDDLADRREEVVGQAFRLTARQPGKTPTVENEPRRCAAGVRDRSDYTAEDRLRHSVPVQ